MPPPDVPEILIALGLIAILVWAFYDWRHRAHTR